MFLFLICFKCVKDYNPCLDSDSKVHKYAKSSPISEP